MADSLWQELREAIEKVVEPYVGQILYGDVRAKFYEGGDGAEASISVAYETPGGSTNQISVTYEDGRFRMLDQDAEAQMELPSVAAVVEAVGDHIRQIPAHRRRKLEEEIARMLEAGQTRRDVLQELNRCLRLGSEFRGGSLTVEELTEACQFLVRESSQAGG